MKVEIMMKMQELAVLTEKYIKRTLTQNERDRLKNMVLKNKKNFSYFKQQLAAKSQHQLYHDFDVASAFEAFEPLLSDAVPSKKRPLRRWMPYAAALIGVVLAVAVVFRDGNPMNRDTLADAPQIQTQDEENIVLTLADGTEKILGTATKNVALNRGGKLQTEGNDELDYSVGEAAFDRGYHKLYIPNGQKFHVTLSDGTKVWLNSGSTLTFPPRFEASAENRIVYLEGEAYFDVAEDKDFPFIVTVNDLNVKVLGTEFNVSAYRQQAAVATTLIEGSVRLYDGNSSTNSIQLHPNEQGTFDKYDKTLSAQEVDVQLFTAWMENRVVFNDMPLSQILQILERTYNVDIVNENTTIGEEKFTGEFDVEDIQTIFKALSTSINFDYELEPHRITIKK
ncbi:MAG: FecR domain-containing protein [Flavobacteriaceae bacterium]|nr:FecR domain-containing protein [Flavobacteriaceae bacterium]